MISSLPPTVSPRKAPHGPRLLIADDHAVFAEALRVLLLDKYDVVGAVGDGQTLVTEAVRLQPEVLVVDVGMPLLNGLDAVRTLKSQVPAVKVVFLTMQNDANLAAAAAELGAIGFVLKQHAATELLSAIESVLHGKQYITPSVRTADWFEAKTRARQYTKELSPRQKQIVQMVAEGRPLKEIAAHLRLSGKTIEFHKHNIMQQYNLRSTADLVLFAIKERLIQLPFSNHVSYPFTASPK
jgi:DNA-binding NarL/FixJ family response regulator